MRWEGADGRAKLRKVIKADVASSDAPAPRVVASAPETLNDYEREREVRRSPLSHRETRRSPTRARRSPPLWPHPSQERIARNKLVLQGLKVKETARALESTVASAAAAADADAAASKPRARKPKAPPRPLAPNPPARPARVPSPSTLPTRATTTSSRRCATTPTTPQPPHVRRVVRARGHHPRAEDDGALRRMGFGRGAGRHGARRLRGGGVGTERGGNADRKPAKGESAKEFARRMMKKNPNAYFYRHNPPGEDAWHGDWSEDEIRNFVDVAKTHGCGDKWGLFASHVPHRVGYQCSAVYRHVIIPRGLLRDDNFVLDKAARRSGSGDEAGAESARRREKTVSRVLSSEVADVRDAAARLELTRRALVFRGGGENRRGLRRLDYTTR